MKKKSLALLAVLFIINLLTAQTEIIKNPKHPKGLKNPDKIRVLKMIKKLEILDGQGECYFKSPRNIKIAGNGDVFVQDDNHLYQFDSAGKYIRDLVVKGQGPGEINYLFNFFPIQDQITLSSVMPVKVVIKKITDGSLIEEFKLPKAKTFSQLLKVVGDQFFFTFSDFNFTTAQTGVKKKDNKFMMAERNGKLTNWKLSFETMDAMVALKSKSGNSISLAPVTRLLTALDNQNLLYVAHTERYLIHQIHLDQDRIIGSFSREYEPVNFIKENTDKEDPASNPSSIYKRESFTDILQLKWVNQKLLVFTSTFSKGKGVLVDVFDQKGSYQDCFYLNLPGLERNEELTRRPITFHNGFLWTSYKDEDENPVIVKFKIHMER